MASVADDDRFSPARRRSMSERVAQSMERPVDARTFHAWQNIEERSVRAAAAMNTHFEAIARRHACTPSQAQARFNEMMDRGYRVGGEAPVAPDHVTFSMANLPRDEHTRHALAMLYETGPSHLDTEGRRIQAQARILATSTQIANGTHATSGNAAENCPDCGQFAGTGHTCPPVNVSAPNAVEDTRALAPEPIPADVNGTLARLRRMHPDDAAQAAAQYLSDRSGGLLGTAGGTEVWRGAMSRLSAPIDNGTRMWHTTDGAHFPTLEHATLHQAEIDLPNALLRERATSFTVANLPDSDTENPNWTELEWTSTYDFVANETGMTRDQAQRWVNDVVIYRLVMQENAGPEGNRRMFLNPVAGQSRDPRQMVIGVLYSDMTQGALNCSDCGQFTGTNHTCPTPAQTLAQTPAQTSTQDQSRDQRLLRETLRGLHNTLDDPHGSDRREQILDDYLASRIADRDDRAFTAAALERGITFDHDGGYYLTNSDIAAYQTSEEIIAHRFEEAWAAGSRLCPSCRYLHVPGGCGPHGYRVTALAVPGVTHDDVLGLPHVRRTLATIAESHGDGSAAEFVVASVAGTTGMSRDEARALRIDLNREVTPADATWEHPGFMSAHGTFHATREEAIFETFAERWQGGHRRCPGCGQFASPSHACQSRAEQPSPVVATAPSAPVPPPPTRTTPPTQPAAPTRQRTPLRSYGYDAADGTRIETRTMNLSALRAEAGNGRMVEVSTRISNADQVHQITGTVVVEDQGGRIGRHRDRFSVGIVNDPGAAETNGGHANSLRCTCPTYQANYDCEHLRQTTSHLMGLLNRREAPAIPPRAVIEAVENDLRAEYNASLGAQADARAAFAGAANGASYSEDMDAFQNAWEEARDHFAQGNTDLPYMRENATGGLGAREGGRSFGIEIEVDFPDDTSFTAKESVAREIYEAGLSQSPYVQGWHYIGRAGGGYTDAPDNWSVEFDRSVDGMGGRRGCEIVSPIMYDEPQTWQSLEKICEIVQRHGGQVTTRTGLHVNVGASDFDHTVENHNRLLRLGMGYEDVLIRTSHNPQSATRHRGRDYCRPMAVPANGYTSIRGAQRSVDPYSDNGSSHRAMINLDHVPAEGQPVTSSTRVEVRVFDGAVDPGRIQTNVKVALGLVNAAARGAATPDTTEAAGTHRATNMGSNGRMRRLSGDEWRADTASFRSLADTIFTREEDKRQLTYAFASSRWQAGAHQFSAAYSA